MSEASKNFSFAHVFKADLIWLFLARLLPSMLGLIKILFIQLSLNPNDGLTYYTIASVIAVVISISSGWVTNYIMRSVSTTGFADTNFANCSYITGVLIGSVSASILVLALTKSPYISFFAFIITLCIQVQNILGSIYWIKNRIIGYTLSLCAFALIEFFAFSSIIVIGTRNLNMLYILIATVSFICTLILILYSRNIIGIGRKNNFGEAVEKQIKYGLPLSLSLSISLGFYLTDRLYLSNFSAEFGLYFVTVYALYDQSINMIVGTFNQRLQKKLFIIWDQDDAVKKVKKELRTYTIACIAACLIIFFISWLIIYATKHKIPMSAWAIENYFVVIVISLAVMLFRLSQIINKAYELNKNTTHFLLVFVLGLIIKLVILQIYTSSIMIPFSSVISYSMIVLIFSISISKLKRNDK